MFYQCFRPIGLTWIYVVIIYSICLFIPLTFPLYVSTAIAMSAGDIGERTYVRFFTLQGRIDLNREGEENLAADNN